ncbi:transcriptional regulator, GntR family [Actinomadura meyerae]|uniref:Transcriptional regulator, GntR family n=1 Tax=Actinomadura meyerae TaxID=240840 RepID=A0A239P4R0_9ACTN|nr:GntR family transcriptional regulator [Actinomadura meyerae]SNT62111.1 transcriptional regulator, GntR family [Actinomadura meyerae]
MPGERPARGRESMTQVVARRLRDSIQSGELEPGARVRQETVAAELGVSRIPVREALRQLESEGLVVIVPNSGAKVAVLDFEEYTEIYKMRERLEPLAFSESVGRLTGEQRDDIARLLAELEAVTGDGQAYLEGDRRFHLACYAGVPTPRLLKMIVDFWNTTQRYRRILIGTFSRDDYELNNFEHRLIAEAALNGSTRRGEDLIRMHIERSRLRLSHHRGLFDR